jgi:hypothetical protein
MLALDPLLIDQKTNQLLKDAHRHP